ncbi:MAG: tetratricopeptide repeat protein [Gammaproteobacteria bacterium]
MSTLFGVMLNVAVAGADHLETLPVPWKDRLTPVPAMDLSALSRSDRETLGKQRARVSRLLVSRPGDSQGAEDRVTDEGLSRAWGRLGALYQTHGQHTAAAISFDNARQLEPNRFRWAYYRGWVSLSLGDNAVGLRYLDEAEAIRPGYLPLRLRRADALLALGRPEQARALYEGLVDEDGLAAAAAFGLGQIALAERDWNVAEAHLRRSLEVDPDASRARYSLALALRGQGDHDAARAQLRLRGSRLPRVLDPLVDALSDLSDPSLRHFQSGMDAIRDHDYGAAVGHFEKGLEHDPGNARARVTLGRVLYLSGQPERARTELQRALSQDCDALLPRFLLAVLLAAEPAREAEGLALISEVLERDPGHEGALLWRANAAMRAAAFEDAARLFAVVARRGTDMEAVYLQHWVALRLAGADGATQREALRRGLDRKPGDPLLRYAYLRLLTEGVPESAAAQAVLKEAEDLAAAFPAPRHDLLLARALALNGRHDDAARLLGVVNDMLGGFGPSELAEDLAAYARGDTPDSRIAAGDPLLFVPPADPLGPFRNYPDPRPF